MKRDIKILPGIIFLLAVLFCPAINAYSNFNIQTTITANPAVDNSGENNSSSDIDFFDDEQINQISDYFPESEEVYHIIIFQNCILISKYPSPIWQPPKNVSFNV